LGNVLRVIGNLEQSQQVLRVSLEIAQSWRSPQDESKAWLNLGNTERAIATRAGELENTTRADTYTKNALADYQQAVTLASPSIKLQAQLNQLDLFVERVRWQEAEALLSPIRQSLAEVPLSREEIYAKINLAKNLVCLKQGNPSCLKQKDPENRPPSPTLDEQSYSEAIQLLETAVQKAKQLEDNRTQSYALGLLGRLSENLGAGEKAKEYTEQALKEAWQSQASDLTYQWQWQLGRLLKTQGKSEAAIAVYRQAVKTLQSLRRDLVSINPEIQFTFRESVEPLYREYVGLLLPPQGTAQVSQQNLADAREAIDSLQLAELENFFRVTCLDAQSVLLDQVTDRDDPTAAVIYPILLEDRFEIIIKLPQQPLRHYTTPIDNKKKVERILGRLVQSLTEWNSQETLTYAQQVYNWLLRPAEGDLAKSPVKTLVFVLDSALRNVPMAVLYDGQKYLVEKYGIALTPGLQLLDPRPLKRGELRALTAGLSEARRGFPSLRFVPRELKQVQSQVPRSLELLNQEFTSAALQNTVNSAPFPVIHLATHGQFSSQAEETFILTWDGPLNVNQLNNFLRSRDLSRMGSIELLVLSACETLTGDQRAALGLAGVAIRAGARSTLATLWSVNDEATAFVMGQFYEALKDPTVTKAEALRRAQLCLLKDSQFERPHFWAPYVLVGNWL
jgi:CHAT domain-containing protein